MKRIYKGVSEMEELKKELGELDVEIERIRDRYYEERTDSESKILLEKIKDLLETRTDLRIKLFKLELGQ